MDAKSEAILSECKELDIKNETLKEEFEEFVEDYEYILSILPMKGSNIDPSKKEEFSQELESFVELQNQIEHNTYLNMEDDDIWIEDFSPEKFSKLYNNIIMDLSEKASIAAKQDIDFTETNKGSAIEREFSGASEMAERAKGKPIAPTELGMSTTNKTETNRRAQTEWRKNFALKLKVNQQFREEHRQKLKQRYNMIKDMPEFKAKAKIAYDRNNKKLSERRALAHKILESTSETEKKNLFIQLNYLLSGTKKYVDPHDKDFNAKLFSEAEDIASKHKKYIQKLHEYNKARTTKLTASPLGAILLKLNYQIANANRMVKERADERYRQEIVSKITEAKKNLDNNPSAENQKILTNIENESANKLKKYHDKYLSDIIKLKEFEKKLILINNSDVLTKEEIHPEIITGLQQIINKGKELLTSKSNWSDMPIISTYVALGKSMQEAVNLLESRIIKKAFMLNKTINTLVNNPLLNGREEVIKKAQDEQSKNIDTAEAYAQKIFQEILDTIFSAN